MGSQIERKYKRKEAEMDIFTTIVNDELERQLVKQHKAEAVLKNSPAGTL